MTRTIEIIVSPQGETRLQTKGFIGSGCRTASKSLETALGLSTSESLTSQFHQSVEQENPNSHHA